MELPVVDFSSWYNPQDEGSRQRVAQELVDACQRVGFVRIINHSIPESTLDETFKWVKKLFALPEEEKMKAPHPEGWELHRGYSWPGLEKVMQLHKPDEDERKRLREVPDVKVCLTTNFLASPDGMGFSPARPVHANHSRHDRKSTTSAAKTTKASQTNGSPSLLYQAFEPS